MDSMRQKKQVRSGVGGYGSGGRCWCGARGLEPLLPARALLHIALSLGDRLLVSVL